jgi:hypothetical protein
MATNSRSAAEFLRRHRIEPETPRPAPRLCPEDLTLEHLPVESPPGPDAEVLGEYEGDPSPDRAAARPLPEHDETLFNAQ